MKILRTKTFRIYDKKAVHIKQLFLRAFVVLFSRFFCGWKYFKVKRFESNIIRFSQSVLCYYQIYKTLGEKDKECSSEWQVNEYGLRSSSALIYTFCSLNQTLSQIQPLEPYLRLTGTRQNVFDQTWI